MSRLIKEATKLKKRLYVVAIDASKAFDKVIRPVLWMRLHNQGIPANLIMAIESYYEKLILFVMKEKEISRVFKASLGVKQGGSISPWLFAQYYEGLIDIIQLIPGAQIGNIRICIVLFADDVVLYSFNKRDAQKQLDMASRFSLLMGIAYNPKKTVYMIFNERVRLRREDQIIELKQPPLVLLDKPIEKVKNMKYLGYIVSCDGNSEPRCI